MKKLLIFLLAMVTALTFTACKAPEGSAPASDTLSDGVYTYALYGDTTVYTLTVSGDEVEWMEVVKSTDDGYATDDVSEKRIRVYSGTLGGGDNGVYVISVTRGTYQLVLEGDEEAIAQYRAEMTDYYERLKEYGDYTEEEFNAQIAKLNGEVRELLTDDDVFEISFSVENKSRRFFRLKEEMKAGEEAGASVVYNYRDDGSLESEKSYYNGMEMLTVLYDKYNNRIEEDIAYTYHDNGIIKTKTWLGANGKPEQISEYNSNGKINKSTGYNNDGSVSYISYYDNGVYTRSEDYADGKLTTLTVYHENGYTVTQYYESGIKAREYTVDLDGNVVDEKSWDEEGNEIIEEKEDGYAVEVLDENGNVIGSDYYIDDELIYQERTNPDGSMYIKEYSNGVLAEEEYFNKKGELVKRITYDEDETREYYYENDVHTHTVTYDKNGTVKAKGYYDSDGRTVRNEEYTDGALSLVHVWEYHGNGNPSKRSTYYGDGNLSYVVEFDENGNVITEEGDGPAAFEEKNVYSENGKLIGKDTYNYGVLVYEVRYDEAGNVIKEANYNSDGTTYWVREYYSDGSNKYWATYDESGRLKKETWYNTDGSWRWKSYYTNGNVEEEFHVEADGSTSAWWTYDENGNLTDKFPSTPTPTPAPTYDADGNLVSIGYYDDGVTKQSEIATASDGTRVWAKFYYEDGTLSSELTYNSAGKLLRDKTYASDGTLEYDMQYVYSQFDATSLTTITKKDADGKLTYKWVGGGGIETVSSYENGVLVKEESRYTNGHRFAVTNYKNGVKTELVGYNKDNRMINKIVFYSNGDHKTVIEYDPSVSGRIIKQEDFAKNGTRTYLMEYEADGSKREKSWNEDGSFKGHFKTEYNEKGHIKTTYEYYANGVVNIECGYADYSVMKYIIWYDEEGNVLDREDY